jgi:hypothetical protein
MLVLWCLSGHSPSGNGGSEMMRLLAVLLVSMMLVACAGAPDRTYLGVACVQEGRC